MWNNKRSGEKEAQYWTSFETQLPTLLLQKKIRVAVGGGHSLIQKSRTKDTSKMLGRFITALEKQKKTELTQKWEKCRGRATEMIGYPAVALQDFIPSVADINLNGLNFCVGCHRMQGMLW